MLEWKNRKSKVALLKAGVRQVGKTTSIKSFAKHQYSSFIELNFERNPSYRKIFDSDLDVNTIIETEY